MKLFHPSLFAVLLLGAGALARADNVKVDIDAGWPARSDTTAAGFLQWALTGDLDATKRTASRTFANGTGTVTCTVRQAAPTAANATVYLNANWANKNGIAGGYKLAFDAVWVHQKDDTQSIDRPYLGGGALDLVISGLPAGSHTITTYHNNLWGSTYGTMSKCVVSVGGSVVATVTPSSQVTNDNDCAYAFFTVNATDGQPVTINLAPDHSGAFDNVVLNGFEIDRPAAPGTIAIAPSPADGDEHVFANNDTPAPGSEGQGRLTLSWTPAAQAVSQDVYFGTDATALQGATRSSPLYRGNQTASTFSVQNLSSALTYSWRIDTVTAAGTTITGTVWSFRTRHLAFPGAEGYGRFARGGRGGRVIEVTNLLDYDGNEAVIPGSYRAAIEATGPRTIVFRVSGLIPLKRPCTIDAGHGYVTIAGQTAPGEGICLSNYRGGVGATTDVVMRFMRDRVGDYSRDAMDGIGLGSSDDSIIDHCSISWALDEGTSSRGGHDITFQRNIVSEGLQHSYHYAAADRTKYETHAFAGSISGNIGSYHHNLLAHCTDRNWSLAGGLTQDSKYDGYLDIRNNVVYNWTARTTDGGVMQCNYVNNYYKPYTKNPYVTWLLKLDAINQAWGIPKYYFVGNVMEGKDYLADNWSTAFQNGATVAALVRSDQPLFDNYVTTQTAAQAYKVVLSDVGANQPMADVIDRRIIDEVRTGTTHYEGTLANNWPNGISSTPNYPGIIDTQTDVKDAVGSPNFPWPAYVTYQIPVDSDHDGMPDYWERAIGSDPNQANSNDDPDGDGYTLLEDYLNWLAGPHAVTTNNQAIDLDLKTLAAGFTAPTFTISGATLGAAVLQADGRIVRFTPAAGASGKGGFSYTVTDSDGQTLSGTYGVCVCATAPAYQANAIGQLTNLSVRAVTRSRDNPLTLGFVVVGGTKQLLVRAIGPTLAAFGVSGTIPDPKLDLYGMVNGTNMLLAANDNWADANAAATLRPIFNRTGAFGLDDTTSKDSALVATGGNSATVSGASSALVYDTGNRSGIALAELYDAEPTSSGRLINASVLNFAGTGDNVLIVGFSVDGTNAKRLLIRAIGPTLGAFGRSSALADPKLEVYTADNQYVAGNDNWGTGDLTQLRAAFRATGAFDLPDTTSKDSVLIVTVKPGGYSAVVSGAAGTTGDALLEVYELP